jgi:ligand-binding sensor domain-containing protein
LASNIVYAIAIDAQGNKWFGTIDGVSKFDGTNWTTYTRVMGLPSNSIRAIAIDAQGNKWFGTRGGVSKFDGTNWTTYDTATTSHGLANNYVYAVAIDAQGNKWFGTYGGGVSMYDGANWTTYFISQGLASNYVYAVAIDAQGNKWFGTAGGVSKFDGINWTTYTLEQDFMNYSVYSIAFDAQGNKWFGTYGRGVSEFNENGIASDIEQNRFIPFKFSLNQNYPNPFNPTTTISFSTPSKSYVSLKIFDVIGREVATLISGELSGGDHFQQWNASCLPSGVYFYRLQAASFTETKKLVLLR